MSVTIDRLTPTAPKTLEETGLAPELVYQILTRTMHIAGANTGTELAAKLGVTFGVIEPVVEKGMVTGYRRPRKLLLREASAPPRPRTIRKVRRGCPAGGASRRGRWRQEGGLR